MTCPGCGNELARREIAQSVRVGTEWVRPASFCDACCRANLTKPGSPESLERLARGEVDPVESARIAEIVSQW